VLQVALDKAIQHVNTDPKTPEKDGALARRVADGAIKTLMTGQGHYKGFAFDETGSQLAFLSERDDYKADASPFKLYYWSDRADAATELASAKTAGMTPGWAPSENGTLSFSVAIDGAVIENEEDFGLIEAPFPASTYRTRDHAGPHGDREWLAGLGAGLTWNGPWGTLMSLRGRITMIAISHEPALVDVADRIYRIEDQTVFIDRPEPEQISGGGK
jgi:hypothetical protein